MVIQKWALQQSFDTKHRRQHKHAFMPMPQHCTLALGNTDRRRCGCAQMVRLTVQTRILPSV